MKKENSFLFFDEGADDSEVEHYDSCIIGGGPAGLTAALYAARYGLSVGLISKDIGGMANLAHRIENYPGFEGSGFELMQKFKKQVEKHKVEILGQEVKTIKKDETGFVIHLKNEKVVHTKTLIVSSGTDKRKLNIPGEKELLGRGVSYCVTCDGMFFKNRVVGVIGGRNSALKAASFFSEIAKKTYLIYRGEELKADSLEIENLKKSNKTEIILNAQPERFIGEKKLEAIEINQKGEKRIIPLEGIFIEIGTIPTTEIIQDLKVKTDEQGFISVTPDMETNIPGLFAAGDAIKSKLKQVIVSAGQGAIAAKSAYDFLSEKK
jgi:thioredoxin reductase (NADPH)